MAAPMRAGIEPFRDAEWPDRLTDFRDGLLEVVAMVERALK